ncbi:hypothetical protein [Mycobacterium sp.]|uniref:hypothetical protein n=1 Tax=Mycobacterium sp. TaxID=1785 RepID=UPI002C67B647|nr:hypothetical protein [Mycobacterium sp.]HTQ18522.1 hypothetical protein [Mycobacterium sp.]
MNYPQGPGPNPQHGQPPHGQPQYGQPQYGQPQYGQPQYGQPPGSHQPYPQAPPPRPQAPPPYPQAPSPYPQQAPSSYPSPGQPANVQQPGPQGYGQPSEGIAVTTRFFPMAFLLLLVKPKIIVDGYEAPATGWGRTVVPARPGPHHVHVHVPYFLPSKIGPADTTVDVYPGRVVDLEYKAPIWTFSGGSLGPPPQKFNGLGIYIALMVVCLLLVLLPLLVALGRS